MGEDAGREALAELAQAGGPGGVVEQGSAVAVAEAQVDVHAVARLRGVEQRHEARAHALPACDLAHDLAQQHAAVGTGEALAGRERDLELMGRVLGEEALGLEAGVEQRPHHAFGEGPPRAAARRA